MNIKLGCSYLSFGNMVWWVIQCLLPQKHVSGSHPVRVQVLDSFGVAVHDVDSDSPDKMNIGCAALLFKFHPDFFVFIAF